jgi:Flp pilus assembly protein TadG
MDAGNSENGSIKLNRLRTKRAEQGFSLVLVAVCSFVMIGLLGLAFDTGRMFIVKSELQIFADGAALAAVSQMDGTQAGITAANATAAQGPLGSTLPNAYNFETATISNVTATYATGFNGTYDTFATASTPATNSYSFIRLTATASVPLNFLPVLSGIAGSMTVSATATAGQTAQSSVNGNLEPFMPDGHSTTDTKNFGFTPGVAYTLKWGNGSSTCAGDVGWTDPNPSSQHGFMDLGQGNGNSSLTQLIEWGGYPNSNSTPSSVYAGMSLNGVPGNRGTQIFDHLNARAEQDTDDVSTTYAEYVSGGTGNGRRVVILPVGNPSTWSGNGNGSETVMGFAAFFLNPSYSGNSGAICATYIGPANMNGSSSGSSDGTKIYYNVLFQ